MPLLKHAGITTWHSLTAVTMANTCKWRRALLSLRPCHRSSDTSHRTPSMLGEKKKKLKKRDKRMRAWQWPHSGRTTGVTPLSPFSLLFVMYSFGLFASLFFGRSDRFTWAGFFEVKMQTAPCCSQSSSNQGLIPVIKICEITLIHHSPSTPIG